MLVGRRRRVTAVRPRPAVRAVTAGTRGAQDRVMTDAVPRPEAVSVALARGVDPVDPGRADRPVIPGRVVAASVAPAPAAPGREEAAAMGPSRVQAAPPPGVERGRVALRARVQAGTAGTVAPRREEELTGASVRSVLAGAGTPAPAVRARGPVAAHAVTGRGRGSATTSAAETDVTFVSRVRVGPSVRTGPGVVRRVRAVLVASGAPTRGNVRSAPRVGPGRTGRPPARAKASVVIAASPAGTSAPAVRPPVAVDRAPAVPVKETGPRPADASATARRGARGPSASPPTRRPPSPRT